MGKASRRKREKQELFLRAAEIVAAASERFTKKEIALTVIGVALSLGQFASTDPYVVIPMLAVAVTAFIYLLAIHQGMILKRVGIGTAVIVVLTAIGGRAVIRNDEKTPPSVNANGGLRLNSFILGGQDYAQGAMIGGIKWDPLYTDVRVQIINGLNIPLEKLDLVIAFDAMTSIVDAKQLTSIPDVSITPLQSKETMMTGKLEQKDKDGNITSTPFSGPSFNTRDNVPRHITCPRLSPSGEITLIFATRALGPRTSSGLPNPFFLGRNRPSTGIKIEGSYETGVVDGPHRYSVDYSQAF